MSFLVKKTPNTTFTAPVRLRLVSKIHKKLIEFFHKSVILTVVAKMGEKAFFSQSENHFLHIPAGENWFDKLMSLHEILANICKGKGKFRLVCLNNPNPAQLS